MRDNLIPVGQIPGIDGEIDAIGQPRPLVAAAGRHPRLLADVLTGHRQAAACTAALASALACGMTGANIVGPENVQQGAA